MNRVSPALGLGIATFLGAFLLFFVQPLMGRFILPWFGGSAAVWSTCLLFFQICLLGGYAYAHGLSRLGSPRVQAVVHGVLLALALLALPIAPAEHWKPGPEAGPVRHILLLLGACVGLPFLVLSATGPLMQAWFSRLCPGRSPYRLYALSNTGSLLALLSYPMLFEPLFPRWAQAMGWSWLFGLYCAVQVFLLVVLCRKGAAPVEDCDAGSGAGIVEVEAAAERPGTARWLLWLALPACSTLLLMAVTNKLCQDVASVPFLWVLPLSIYLLSFIVCFENSAWYHRGFMMGGLAVTFGLMCYAILAATTAPWMVQAGIYGAALFFACMVCHGELYRLRPAVKHLTAFYLMIAAGGALGGLFVAVLAPAVFSDHWELHLGMLAVGVLVVAVLARERTAMTFGPGLLRAWPIALVLVGLLGGALWLLYRNANKISIAVRRNFYGVLRVELHSQDNPLFEFRVLRSGETVHGIQFHHPVRRVRAVSYYGENSGVWRAWQALPPGSGRRVGVVGLGTGSLSTYGRCGDLIRFYDINPQVEELARSHFSYLVDGPAKTEVVLGDARLVLEREAPQAYDFLALDAFSSDAIPIHLLTREAFEQYARHLKPGGILAVHLSNRHLNLGPVVKEQARAGAWHFAEVWHKPPQNVDGLYPSYWVLLTRDPTGLKSKDLKFEPPPDTPQMRLWTDEYASVFRVFTGTSHREPGS